MKENEEWKLFERLADPDLPAAERLHLEHQLAADREAQIRYEAFCLLKDWPRLEPAAESAAARRRLLERIQDERTAEVADQELGRLFPLFMGGALAAALALALFNFWEFGELAGGTVEAFFGMPRESVESVFVSQL